MNVALIQSIINARTEQKQEQNVGADSVLNTNKETKTMNDFVIKLTAYRDGLIKGLEETKAHDDNVDIEKEVAIYREELIKKYAIAKATKVQKYESDIDCLNNVLNCEAAKCEA